MNPTDPSLPISHLGVPLSHGPGVSSAPLDGFEMVRPIGEGSMGTVYEAWQLSPRRRTAVKLLRPGLVTPALLKRFQLEVEILGRLEHPAVARIYAAGAIDATGTQRPYFAMEYIEGTPITAYANERNLSIHERIALLIEVADGVHHAHQKGVIHRDLKPANILVTPAGRPKVLDFGIALVTDPGLQLTLMPEEGRGLLGTLDYMSPEQAAGDASALDVRTDVYALGTIAFEMLAGRLPRALDGLSLQEALRRIDTQEPPRLGDVVPSRSGDLEWIIGKALARSREQRYDSAATWAADLRRYLAGEPIEARPPSRAYQWRMFARRNKPLMTAAALIFLSLACGLLLAGAGLLRAQRAEAEAVHQRIRAEENLKQALDTVDQFMTTVAQGQLRSAPEWQPLRNELLRSAVAFYERLQRDNPDNPELRRELGWAQTHMAEAQRQAGAHATAGQLFHQRSSNLVAALAHEPDRLDTLRDLARSWDEAGDDAQRAGRLEEAETAYVEGTRVKQRMRALRPDDAEFLLSEAHTWDNLGRLRHQQKRTEEALAANEQALQIKLILETAHPDQPDYRRSLAWSWAERARLAAAMNRQEEARQSFDRARALFLALTGSFPHDPSYARDLARCLGEWARTLAALDDDKDAARYYEEAYRQYQQLLTHAPGNRELRTDMAFTLGNWSNILPGPQARAMRLEAQTIWRDLLQDYPDAENVRKSLAWIERRLAEDAHHDRPGAPIAGEQKTDRSTQPVSSHTPVVRVHALDTDAVRAAEGRYAAVTGRVVAIHHAVGRNQLTFVHFSAARLQFCGVIHRNVQPAFAERYGPELSSLVDRMIECSGVISLYRDTPQMVLSGLDQVRLLDTAE